MFDEVVVQPRRLWPVETVEKWTMTPVQLIAGKTSLSPLILDDRTLVFLFPAKVPDICLASRSFQAKGPDRRSLGVIVDGITMSNGSGWRKIALDDPNLYAGFHSIEREGAKSWRWTDGKAHISPKLWAGFEDIVLLRITGSFVDRGSA